jgi:plasmid stabilization system protein ParE
MSVRKIAYSEIAMHKRKAIKLEIKQKYGKEKSDEFSNKISRIISDLKKFPEMGVSMRDVYGLDCDYYIIFIEHNYFIYRIMEDMIMILEIFHEKEDFMYQMFGISTTSKETLDYWGE